MSSLSLVHSPLKSAIALCTFLLCVHATHREAFADAGEPVAVRSWPSGSLSLETQWGIRVLVHNNAKGVATVDEESDQVLTPEWQGDHILSRLPNQDKVTWISADDASAEVTQDPNAVRIKTLAGSGNEHATLVQVDQVSVLFAPSPLTVAATEWKLPSSTTLDLLVLSLGEGDELSKAQLQKAVESMKPRSVLLNPLAGRLAKNTLAACESLGVLKNIEHNTMPLSKPSEESQASDGLPIFVLSDSPWEMPSELAELFAAMEKDCSDSQAVFAKLSTKQMNFKPSNGTHTPRWNTEHMMGRQLGFFSQIYHTQNPVIPVMNLNPEQMPPDYKFAHPDWDGKEEARQMQRVSDFTRRFAFLLDGLELDKRAPGSRWPSLRALLLQMQRHYSEHTANTVKKFELPGWPAE